jgi:hypothetical protein
LVHRWLDGIIQREEGKKAKWKVCRDDNTLIERWSGRAESRKSSKLEGRKDRKFRGLRGRKEEEGRMFRVSVAGAIIWADNM